MWVDRRLRAPTPPWGHAVAAREGPGRAHSRSSSARVRPGDGGSRAEIPRLGVTEG